MVVGMKHSGQSPLPRLSSRFWNTSLSWFSSYLCGCSFVCPVHSFSPHCYIPECLRSGPSCTLRTHSLWGVQSQHMALGIISMLRLPNFNLKPDCPPTPMSVRHILPDNSTWITSRRVNHDLSKIKLFPSLSSKSIDPCAYAIDFPISVNSARTHQFKLGLRRGKNVSEGLCSSAHLYSHGPEREGGPPCMLCAGHLACLNPFPRPSAPSCSSQMPKNYI